MLIFSRSNGKFPNAASKYHDEKERERERMATFAHWYVHAKTFQNLVKTGEEIRQISAFEADEGYVTGKSMKYE